MIVDPEPPPSASTDPDPRASEVREVPERPQALLPAPLEGGPTHGRDPAPDDPAARAESPSPWPPRGTRYRPWYVRERFPYFRARD